MLNASYEIRSPFVGWKEMGEWRGLGRKLVSLCNGALPWPVSCGLTVVALHIRMRCLDVPLMQAGERHRVMRRRLQPGVPCKLPAAPLGPGHPRRGGGLALPRL